MRFSNLGFGQRQIFHTFHVYVRWLRYRGKHTESKIRCKQRSCDNIVSALENNHYIRYTLNWQSGSPATPVSVWRNQINDQTPTTVFRMIDYTLKRASPQSRGLKERSRVRIAKEITRHKKDNFKTKQIKYIFKSIVFIYLTKEKVDKLSEKGQNFTNQTWTFSGHGKNCFFLMFWHLNTEKLTVTDSFRMWWWTYS